MKIVEWPNPILKQVCRKITDEELIEGKIKAADYGFDNLTFANLLQEMFHLMKTYKGVGLAAPQIGLPVRIFLVKMDEHVTKMFINPELTGLTGRHPDQEGCLSVPGRYEYIIRAERLTISAISFGDSVIQPIFNRVEIKIKDRFVARIIQHENDHLDGKLFFEKAAMWKARSLA